MAIYSSKDYVSTSLELFETEALLKPSWSSINNNYPGSNIKTVDLYNQIGGQFPKFKTENELASSYLANSCAFRMSRGLNLSNSNLPKPFSKNQFVLKGADSKYYWGRVKELYPILIKMLGKPSIITKLKKSKLGETKEKMSETEMNKYRLSKGVIMFEVSGWGDASGHFTIWNGRNLKYPGNPLHDDSLSDYYYFSMKYEQNKKVIQTDKIILWELN